MCVGWLTFVCLAGQLIFFAWVCFKYLWPLWKRKRQVNEQYEAAQKIIVENSSLEDARLQLKASLFNEPDIRWARNDFERFASAWGDARPHGEERPLVTVRLRDFLSPWTVVEGAANQRNAAAMSGVLLALGIFGTFLGLVIGLQGVHPGGNIQEMSMGIDNLITSLSLAFDTSLLGIFTSIVFSTLHKRFIRETEKVVLALDKSLYKVFPCESSETLARRYIDIQEEIKHGLQTLATDIATRMTETVAPAMGMAVSQQLQPALAETNNLLSASIEGQKEANGVLAKHLDAVGEKQLTATQDALDKYFESMSGNIQEQIGNVAEVIRQTAEAQASIREEMVNFGERLQQQFAAQSTLIEKTSAAGRILSESMDSLAGIAEKLKSSSDDITAAAALLAESAAAARDGQETLREVVASQIEAMRTTRETLSEVWEQITDNMSVVSDHVQGLLEKIESTLGGHLVGALESFDTKVAEVSERFSGTLLEANDTIQEVPGILKSLDESAAMIADGIGGQKAVIGDLRQTVEKFVSPNIDKVSAAANLMATSVDSIADKVDVASTLVRDFDARVKDLTANIDERLAKLEQIAATTADGKKEDPALADRIVVELGAISQTLASTNAAIAKINNQANEYGQGMLQAMEGLAAQAANSQTKRKFGIFGR